MRCSKLCIGLLAIGIGGAVIFASTGNVQAASLLPFLPILACPLMCVAMMMFGKSCKDKDGQRCHDGKEQKTVNAPAQSDHVEK